MKLTTTLLIAATLLLQSAVFSQMNPLAKYIPEDATMVFNIDAKKMASKIPAEVFRQSFLYREMMKDPGMPLNVFFSQPEKAGIDLSHGIMIAMKEGAGRERQPSVHVFIKLLNADLFTATIKELMKNNEDQKISVYGTDRIVETGGGMAVGWNNDVFVMTTGGYNEELMEEFYGQYNFPDSTIMVSDTMAMVDTVTLAPVIEMVNESTAVADTTAPATFDLAGLIEKIKKAQRELCFLLLTPKNNSALLSNAYFNDILKEEADIKFWNGGNMNPLTDKMLPFAELVNQLQPFLSKNKTALINFEKGKIVMKARNFPEPVIAGIYKKYPVEEQNMDLIRRLPEGTLLGLLNVSLNQAIVNEMILKTGLIDILAPLKKDIPFDLSLLPGAFKSNMMIAVLKSNMTTTTDELTSKRGGLQVIAAFPIADKAKFEKLKTAILPAWDSLRSAKGEMFDKSTPYAKHNDELLVISLSPETASAFLNNTGIGSVPEWLQAYSKHPFVLNINIRDILTKSLGNDRPERSIPFAEAKMLNVFGNMLIYGGEYENETINSTMEFTFANPEENSLKQLFDMIATSMERADDEMDMYDENELIDTDTTRITPVSIVVPSFKNSEVQQFANEYADYVFEYIAAYHSTPRDTSKMTILSKKSESWSARSEKIAMKISSDPEEARKFADYMVELSQQWISALSSNQKGIKVQEVTLVDIVQEEKVVEPPPPPPPKTNPPKVEMKKFTPPVIKKQ